MANQRFQKWYLAVFVLIVAIFAIGWWWFRSSQSTQIVQPAETVGPTLEDQNVRLQPATTVLLVRHAEKESLSGDSPLSDEGQVRAQALAHVAGDSGIAAIYATEYLRTQQTAQPLAGGLDLPVQQVKVDNMAGLVDQILSNHAGQIVLVVGHSDTVPAIIKELGGGSTPPITQDEYDNLYLVTIYAPDKATVVHLNYGQSD